MSVLLHLSDPHFGTEQAPVMDALVALSQQLHPDLLLLSGDITQRALCSQFAAARAFTERLGAPLLAIPGNHDIPLFNLNQRVFHPYRRYQEAFGNALEPLHASSDLLVQCVNTTRWYRHKGGTVSTAQIERVASRLRTAQPAQLRVVVVHQPIAVLRAAEQHNLLHGHTQAQFSWAEAGCDVVLGGHIHLPYVTGLPDLPRPMWAVQAGTSISSRVRAGASNSVNVLRWGAHAAPGCCTIEQWDYATTTKAFVCTHTTDIHPARTTA
jgi:predicted MPP superfamily phosphohydrolase